MNRNREKVLFISNRASVELYRDGTEVELSFLLYIGKRQYPPQFRVSLYRDGRLTIILSL